MDGTSQILSNQLDPRIIVVTNIKNIGLSASLNIGIHKSKGKYIAFCDDDDLWDPKKLEMQLDFMEKNNAGICFCFRISRRRFSYFLSGDVSFIVCDFSYYPFSTRYKKNTCSIC